MAGSIWLRGSDLIIRPGKDHGILNKLGFVKKEEKEGLYHTLPLFYSKVKKLFPDMKELFSDDPLWNARLETRLRLDPRDYQNESLDKWMAEKRGYLVLVTGAGKTILALMAIDALRTPAIVIVPTIDLLLQWKESIVKNLSLPENRVGILGGGSQEIKEITVATYDSARLHLSKINKFPLVIFDEVHHLPARENRRIAEGMISPYRMGLTATPERTDGLHEDLFYLVGPEIIRKGHDELKPYIADFRIEKISIQLSPKEQYDYDSNRRIYRSYIGRKRLFRFGKNAYMHIIMRSSKDPEARKALLAHRDARKISFNAKKKIDQVLEILSRHKDDKVILFSEFNSIVDEISYRYLIPAITYRTKPKERKAILDNFRNGTYTKIVTGKVLDEGVDVPDASIGIIISGTGSERSYIQRLGRILRPKKAQAVLYELVSASTGEMRTASRRRLRR